MVLTAAEYTKLQTIRAFQGLKVNAEEGSDGSFTIELKESDWKIFQMNIGKSGATTEVSGGPGAAGAMKLQVSMDAHGFYILVLTETQWELLQANGGFDGMRVKPHEGSDGTYTIKLSEYDWEMFQANQSGESEKRTRTVSGRSTMKLSVTMDASA